MQALVNPQQMLTDELEKIAVPSVSLPADVDRWPEEIVAQLHRQVPFASAYDVTVTLRTVDKESLYAHGWVTLTTKILRPDKQRVGEVDANRRQPTVGRRQVLVPLIVNAGRLAPMDVFYAGKKVFPLTKRRVERALFRPDLFDIQTVPPAVSSWSGRTAFGRGGLSIGRAGGYKFAHALAHTISPGQLEGWTTMLSTNPMTKTAVLACPAVATFLTKLAVAAAGSRVTTVDQVYQSIPPTAIQLSYVDGHYRLKTANRRFYQPRVVDLDRRQALKLAGADLVHAVDVGGPQTRTLEAGGADPAPDVHMAQVVESGRYRVRTPVGQELTGRVFVNVFDFDGRRQPFIVFTGADGADRVGAVQPGFVGHLVDKRGEDADGVGNVDEQAEGFGLFVKTHPQTGEVVAYGPTTVITTVDLPEGRGYRVELFDGRVKTLVYTDGVAWPTSVDNQVLIPNDFRWWAVGRLITLAETPDQAKKIAGVEDVYRRVRVWGGPTSFSFDGPCVDKLAHADRHDLDVGQAEFLAATLGWQPHDFHRKTADRLSIGRAVMIDACLPISLSEETKMAAALSYAVKVKAVDGLRVDLIKLASTVGDPDCVDAMLSLNFLTPENLEIFIGYKDELDQASQRLAELLWAVRVGLSPVPEGALRKGIDAIEKVITGLEHLRQEV